MHIRVRHIVAGCYRIPYRSHGAQPCRCFRASCMSVRSCLGGVRAGYRTDSPHAISAYRRRELSCAAAPAASAAVQGPAPAHQINPRPSTLYFEVHCCAFRSRCRARTCTCPPTRARACWPPSPSPPRPCRAPPRSPSWWPSRWGIPCVGFGGQGMVCSAPPSAAKVPTLVAFQVGHPQ